MSQTLHSITWQAPILLPWRLLRVSCGRYMLDWAGFTRKTEGRMRVLAIIPAYNEEASLYATVASLVAECPQIDYLVVNDGSSDGTAQVIRENHLRAVQLPINTGLASAFRTGMKFAWRHGYDAAIQFDADGQHLPSYVLTMAREMQETSADIVIASRFVNGGRPPGARGVGSALITALIRVTTGQTITDPTSGMRLYGRAMIERFACGFDVAPEPDTIAAAIRAGAVVREIPAQMRERQAGESYLNLVNAIKYMARTCLSILLFQWLR